VRVPFLRSGRALPRHRPHSWGAPRALLDSSKMAASSVNVVASNLRGELGDTSVAQTAQELIHGCWGSPRLQGLARQCPADTCGVEVELIE
jgi:hypothetical protein